MASTGSVTVRDAQRVDAVVCAAIYATYVRETVVSFEEEPPDEIEMTRRIIDAQARHAWLVAERHGEVVGYAYGGAFRTRAAYRHTCEVSVYVARPDQGSGVGTTLYAALLDRMRETGHHLAVAAATMPNEGSERLHRRLGFEVVGTFREVGHKQGEWWDTRWFQKLL